MAESNRVTKKEQREQRIAYELGCSDTTKYDHLSDDEWDKVISKLSGYKIPTQLQVDNYKNYAMSPKGKAKRREVMRPIS